MRSLPPLRLLTVFEAVIRHGNLQQAAGELNVTQPAVSQALRQLEDHLGASLFDRSRRPAAPTEAGLILEAAVRDGLGRISDAVETIRHLKMEEGTVTIACSVGIATYWLMPRLGRFSAEFPDIIVNVMTTNLGAPRLSPAIDLAIRFGAGDWTDGETAKLFDERVVPVATPLVLKRLEKAGHGLERATLLHVNVEESNWLDWGHYLRRTGQPDASGKGRHFTNYVQATQAALTHQGVMLGWESVTGELVREGRLAELPAPPLIPDDAFYLVTAPRAARHRAARQLGAWLMQAPQPLRPAGARDGETAERAGD